MCNEGAFWHVQGWGNPTRENILGASTHSDELAIRQNQGRNPDVASLFLHERACENGEQEGCAEWELKIGYSSTTGFHQSVVYMKAPVNNKPLPDAMNWVKYMNWVKVLYQTKYWLKPFTSRVVIWTCPKVVPPTEISSC